MDCHRCLSQFCYIGHHQSLHIGSHGKVQSRTTSMRLGHLLRKPPCMITDFTCNFALHRITRKLPAWICRHAKRYGHILIDPAAARHFFSECVLTLKSSSTAWMRWKHPFSCCPCFQGLAQQAADSVASDPRTHQMSQPMCAVRSVSRKNLLLAAGISCQV